MEFRELEAMVETHECAQCGGTLVIIHSDGAEPWLLVCGQDHAHKGLKLHESKTTAIARGKGDKVIAPEAQKSLEQSMARARHELSLMPKRDIATGADIRNDQLVGLVKWESYSDSSRTWAISACTTASRTSQSTGIIICLIPG